MEINDRYEALKRKISQRKEPFYKFIHFLETETSWLTSPASTGFTFVKKEGS